MIKLTRMDWDSNFWGVDIYNISQCYENRNYKLEFDRTVESKIFIIQALTTDKDIEYINFLEESGFRFIESKVNLVKRVKNTSDILESALFKDVKLDDLTEYKDEFYSLYGEVSRFSFLPKEKVNEFYYKWVVKSIKGELDDNCIGYYTEGSLGGFVTYKILEQKLIIGLLGVFPEYQGKRISQNLLHFIENVAIKNNCNEIYVSTQGKNTKAINAYIKSGFFIGDIKHWYYLKEGL